MYFMDYNSVKVTNYVQRFCIIPRVRNGVAEFTLLVQLVNNERTEIYDDTYEDHTALSDARIEAAILLAAKAKHKKTRHGSRGQGWRDASAAFKALDL